MEKVEEKSRAASNTQSHILVFPFPIQGHINPMLQLSKRLASKGLKVSLIATTSVAHHAIQLQASATSTIINIETIFDGFRNGEKASSPAEHLETYRATVPKSLADLIQKLGSSPFPVNCVVYDSITPWVSDVARSLGVYGAAFFTQSCAVGGLYYHKIQGSLKYPSGEEEEEAVISLPAYPELKSNDLPSFIKGPGTYQAIYDLAFTQFLNIDKADWLLCNTFTGLEDELVNWMASKWAIMPIGPTIPSMYLDKRLQDDKDYGISLFQPNSDACMEWLNSKQPNSVVYISFGSLASLSEDQMAEMASALKTTNANFLWIVRESEKKKLPTNFADEIPEEKGLILSWCSQLQILAHESVGCFVTHCGWNSTLEALSLGVPMVAMPQWTDQPTNAKFVTDIWRVGVRVKVDENGIASKEAIETCIREVMKGESGKEMRRNSHKWKELAKSAIDEGGNSDKNMEEFVAKLASHPINGYKH